MRFLIIQTAFLGDVVLATPLIEKLRRFYPESRIDFLLRKGNESLLQGNPQLDEVLIWNKKEHKMRNLWKMMREVRRRRYDYVFNLQRFASSGFITMFSGAHTVGFDKNPLSMFFSERKPHVIGKEHEVERNLSLITSLTDGQIERPKLYPSEKDYEKVRPYQQQPYVTLSPASVWYTKQLAMEKWVELIQALGEDRNIYLLGAPGDLDFCNLILQGARNHKAKALCGHFTLLQSAALMKGADMNYVNDSAPMHLSSAMNAPMTAIYCSTVPAFGFGPLSDVSRVVETPEILACRPCGLHGYKECPKGHFKCAHTIPVALIKG
jgi:ADP-heptose:LPS heptosyltransferase